MLVVYTKLSYKSTVVDVAVFKQIENWGQVETWLYCLCNRYWKSTYF